jgi:outer membrane protein OmpA-like peptidoglycan-associated protein
MKNTFTLLFFFLYSISFSQNLVLNPSFEDNIHCPYAISQFNNNVKNWTTPNFASTDYFNNCIKFIGFDNYNGKQNAKTGNGYAGMYFYTDKNYREYVQGALSKTLEEGKEYKVTFYLSLADESSYTIKNIKVLFSEEKLKTTFRSKNIEKVIKPNKATKKRFQLYSNPDEVFFSDKVNWMKFSFQFIAKGYENYFSIGNFNNNSKTKKEKVLSQSSYFFSYYYIDDVSVEPLEKEIQKQIIVKQEIKKESLVKNKVYIFKNVLFDFDKSELLEVSLKELNQLYNYLEKNSNLQIEIYGHTDSVGTQKRNDQLSKERAKAVSTYFISKGLNTNRINWFGFGSSKPKDTNETEEGRNQNRRVEFKLTESN